MSRSPLTPKIREAQSFIDQLNGLEPDVRDLVLDLLLPESEEQSKQKKARKKRATSRRGMPERESENCLAVVNDKPCDQPGASLIHDPKGGYAGYHEFQPGKGKAVSA